MQQIYKYDGVFKMCGRELLRQNISRLSLTMWVVLRQGWRKIKTIKEKDCPCYTFAGFLPSILIKRFLPSISLQFSAF